VELVGVADTRPEQAREVATRTGTRSFDHYRELLEIVDAVSIAVPTCVHREVAGAFLERGIATLVEKPLAASLFEAEELARLASERGALLQVGHIERFNPALSTLENLPIRPRYIEAERLSTYTFRSTDIGVVLDLMIHDLDLVLAMVPAAVRLVMGVGVSVFGGHEDIANAWIEFEDGTVACLAASRASVHASRKMRIYGAEGHASLDFATKQGTLIRPSDRLRRGELDIDDLDISAPAAVKERVFGRILRVDQVQGEGPEPLAQELADFVQAARGVALPRVSGQEALRAMRLADQVIQEIKAHRWEGAETGDVVGQLAGPVTTPRAIHTIRGPISWRVQGGARPTSLNAPD
jgi:predicted dehydrogenase